MLMGLQTLSFGIDFSEVGERGGVWRLHLFIKYLERCPNSKDKRGWHNSNTFYFFLSILNPLSIRKSFMSIQRTPFLSETAGILLFFVLLSLAINVQL